MNSSDSIIIKTKSHKETEMAKRTRDVLKESGQDVIIVPHDVTELCITIEQDQLAVIVQHTDNGWRPIDLDIVTGFDSVADCWQYAGVVIHEAELPEDSCEADVFDMED